MIAMELSGAHLGKLLKVTWKTRNKDGAVRANARPKEFYILLRYIEHHESGEIRVGGSYWFSKVPRKIPAHWSAYQREKLSYKGYSHGDRLPAYELPSEGLPYDAEVEVVDG